MGNAAKKGPVPVKTQLANIRNRTEDRMGKVAVTGRYHVVSDGVGLADEFYIDSSRVLGTGMNGSVVVGKRKSDGLDVAIKPYASVGISKDDQRSLRNEVEIFLSLDHPHIARLLDVYEEIDKLWLVMEVCTGGEVLDLIQKRGPLSESKAASLVYQMLLAVNYMHSFNIVHRDIKLENFLFEDNTCSHVKLIDFGMSRYWTGNVSMKISCGTVPYMAPECFNQSYTIKCDMWSMGVVVFGLLSGQIAFTGSEAEQMAAIKAGKYTMEPELWKNVSDTAKDFVTKLLTVDVDQRSSAEEALVHPWIANRDLSAAEEAAQNLDESAIKAMRKFGQATTFRRVAFTMMSYSMSVKDRQKVREAFMAIDKDNTGVITMSELLSVLKSHGVANDEANQMLHTLDANDDSTVHYTEFLAAMMTHSIAASEGHIRAAFNRLDRDNSGSITLENLKATLGETYGGMDMETILAEVDTHNTGYISFDEFMAYLQGGDAEQSHLEFVEKIAEEEKKQAPLDQRNTPAPQQQAGLTAGDAIATAAAVDSSAPLASGDANADSLSDAAQNLAAEKQRDSATTSGYDATASLAVNTSGTSSLAVNTDGTSQTPTSQTQAGTSSLAVNTSQTQAATSQTTPLVDKAEADPKAQPTSQCCSVM